MDTVGLPLLKPGDSVEQALVEMNALDRHEVILEELNGRYRLLRNVDVLAAWRRGVRELGQVVGGQPVAPITGFSNIVALMHTPWGDAHREAVPKTLDSVGAMFGVVAGAAVGRWIHVVTRHEGVAGQSRTKVKACVCKADSKHNGDSPPEDATRPTCPQCSGDWRCA